MRPPRPDRQLRPVKWLIIVAVLLAGFLGILVWRYFARGADTPKVGDAAPEFSLADQGGKTRALADFSGKWLVLYFFPRADTPG